jgi:N-acyl-L-homoserine lactone synthetase
VEDGTMLVEHFGEVFPSAAGFLARQAGRLYELTRFCRSPKISVGSSREMLRVLAEALDAFRDANDITGFVAVVYPPVARFLGRIGVRYLVLDAARMQGREVLLICITHAVEAQRLTLLRRLGLAGVVGDPGPEGPVRTVGASLRDGSPRSPS